MFPQIQKKLDVTLNNLLPKIFCLDENVERNSVKLCCIVLSGHVVIKGNAVNAIHLDFAQKINKSEF